MNNHLISIASITVRQSSWEEEYPVGHSSFLSFWLVGKSWPPGFLSDLEDFLLFLSGDLDLGFTFLFFLLEVGDDGTELVLDVDSFLDRDFLFPIFPLPDSEFSLCTPSSFLTASFRLVSTRLRWALPFRPDSTRFRRAEPSERTTILNQNDVIMTYMHVVV